MDDKEFKQLEENTKSIIAIAAQMGITMEEAIENINQILEVLKNYGDE